MMQSRDSSWKEASRASPSISLLYGPLTVCRCACIFLGGLSLGDTLFGIVSTRLVDRSDATSKAARLLLTYGAIKAAIGVYALLFSQFFRAALSSSLREPWALAVGSQR